MEARGGGAETAPELNSLLSVVAAWDGGEDWEHADVRSPVAEVATEARRRTEQKYSTVWSRRPIEGESCMRASELSFKGVCRQSQPKIFEALKDWHLSPAGPT